MGEAFRFKTPSSTLIVGSPDYGKTCFTESLLLDHLNELFVNPPPAIHYVTGRGKMDFVAYKRPMYNFTKGFPR